jgi:phosphoribosylformylglycinamidine synthase II
VIGEVIAEPVYRVTEGDHVVAEFPGIRLVTDCPVYHPEAREGEAAIARRARDVAAIPPRPEEADPAWTLQRLLSAPTIASKAWVYRQYDSTVRTNTVIGPGGDAAVLRLRGTRKGIAVCTDGNGRYVYLDPRVGGRIAVTEAARNVACAGARPMAITNCLNFGNPKNPETFFMFREAVLGMGDACRALGTPVTGGNVSLYNESPAGAVYPTPIIGMVGVLDDIDHATGNRFTTPGDAIVLLGAPTDELGGSEYLLTVHGEVCGAPPACDPAAEGRLIEALLAAIRAGIVRAAHDVSDGGLAVALAESAIGDRVHPVGVDVSLSDWANLDPRALLFGEGQGRVVVATASPESVLRLAEEHGVPARRIGTVTLASAGFRIRTAEHVLACDVAPLVAAYHDAIPALMRSPAAAGSTS